MTPSADPLLDADRRAAVQRALAEDVGGGDLTAALVPDTITHAELITREPMVLCGAEWVNEVFRQLDARVRIDWLKQDGDSVAANAVLCRFAGAARAILTGERTALNFLQTLSGTATTTAQFVERVRGTRARILDTRKTIPGLRRAQKYAVACGGGHNHRMGLYDAVLIKENHITAAGSISAAIGAARRQSPSGIMIEVEVESLDQLRQAIEAGATRILLDNFDLAGLRKAVEITAGQAELEASGGIGLDNLRAVAETGIDYISLGSLTKHLRAIDLSLRFEA
jgi:nicotinate-nucleotide pyrophosphorylase (carboxylating)